MHNPKRIKSENEAIAKTSSALHPDLLRQLKSITQTINAASTSLTPTTTPANQPSTTASTSTTAINNTQKPAATTNTTTQTNDTSEPTNENPTNPTNTNTSTIPPDIKLPKHVQQALALKNKGYVRISIHRSSAYDDNEIGMIYKSLGVVKTLANPGINKENLIIALAKTTLPLTKEIGLQTNSNDIDTMHQTMKKAFARNVIVPPMTKNTAPLTSTINKPAEIFFNEKAFLNYTTKQIPQSIAIVLSFGSKFSAPIYYKEDDFEKLKEAAIAVNEIFAHPLDRLAIKDHIHEHIENYKTKQFIEHSSAVRDFFTKALNETKQFLKDNKDIVAAQSDKSNVALLMERNTYIAKIDQLLADEDTYTPLRQSSLPAYKIINKKILDRMIGLKWITSKQHTEALRTEVNIANIYALIKTHKAGYPARPVVNTTSAPGYLASKITTMILTRNSNKYLKSKYSITNSKQAIERIQEARITPDMKFRSYDAKSMFTNISAHTAINAIIKRKAALKLDDLNFNLIIDTIKFTCITNTEIKFNDQVYKQIKGIRMGSPLSPILADFVMEDLLDKVFNNIIRPELFIKYVDDILTAVEDEEHDMIFKALNEVDEHLKFEHEVENEDKKINFLDFTVINDRFNLKTKWFQKPIASGRIINFHAHHPATGLRHTAIQYVVTMINNSSPEFHEEMINKAKHLLTINSYPEKEIESIIQTAINKTRNNTRSQIPPSQNTQPQPASQPRPHTSTDSSSQQWRWEPTNTPKDPIYVTSLPYIPSLTNKIQKEIEQSSSQPRNTYSHDFNPKFIKVASLPQHKLSTEIFNKSKKITSGKEIPMIDIDDSDSD